MGMLTPRELSELKSAVTEAVSKEEKLVDIYELATYLDVSASTVERQIRAGRITPIRVGKKGRRFRLSSVIAGLEGMQA